MREIKFSNLNEYEINYLNYLFFKKDYINKNIILPEIYLKIIKSRNIKYKVLNKIKKTKISNLNKNDTYYIVRTGGFGDLLFLTPFLFYLKKEFPELNIKVFTAHNYTSLNYFYPTSLESLPITNLPKNTKFMYFGNSLNKFNCIYELIGQEFGISENKIKNIELKPKLINTKNLRKIFHFDKKRFHILLHPFSTTIRRTIPYKSFLPIIKVLKNYSRKEIILYSFSPIIFNQTLKTDIEVIKNIKILPTILSMRKLVSAINEFNLILSTDTFIIHLAEALNIPTIAFFTQVPSKYRIKHYSYVFGIDIDSELFYVCQKSCLKYANKCKLNKQGFPYCTNYFKYNLDSIEKFLHKFF